MRPHKIRRLLFATAILTMVGCAVQGPSYQQAEPSPTKANVYVYRTYPTLAFGWAVQLPINCGDYSIELGPGGYHMFKVDPGKIMCSAHSENTSNVQFDTQPGHDYYVRAWVSIGVLLPEYHLDLVDASEAQGQLQTCKMQ